MSEGPTEAAPGGYDFTAIEAKWQKHWAEKGTFVIANPGEAGFDAAKPKCYVLDMFPYPSGAGLHVGHPLGYCATDIFCRYKRMRGFNVLHPMGFDAFGLPAEQHAIETGVHPAVTTKQNIDTYRRQLQMLGFSYDWQREVATCEPSYYRWTQWIFVQMFNSWYDDAFDWQDEKGQPYRGRARPIADLVTDLEAGALGVDDAGQIVRDPANHPHRKWSELSEQVKRKVIDGQRLAYLDQVDVNWCPALGTVLANEEVTAEGLSDRGNHPVFRRPLRQWMLRITKYADRLLSDLGQLRWPEPIKLMQRNWIGRSEGADVDFPVVSGGPNAPIMDNEEVWRTRRAKNYPAVPEEYTIRVYTTRPDTLFGATYMVLAPEHPLVGKITTDKQRGPVAAYVQKARHKSEMDRTADTKEKTGVFTGAYALNPVNSEKIPIWVADYVLMGYGTGAIMAVPAHDTRDFEFAKVFDLPVLAVVMPPVDWLRGQLVNQQFDRRRAERTGRAEMVEKLAEGMVTTAASLNFTGLNVTAVLDGDPGWIDQVAEPFFAAHPDLLLESFTGEGTAVNSGEFNGMETAEFKQQITDWLEADGLGRGTVNYKLRDWIFSRQKYWGEPFPVLHSPDGETSALDAGELPLELPPMEDFKPTAVADDADTLPDPPLGRATDWVTVEKDGTAYRRDLNTMPQWAGSCWYYLRFCDPANGAEGWGKMADDYWMPVDVYVGGAEHAVLHLMYARFWHKVLYDLGHVSTVEPFRKLVNQGMIQAFAYRDGRGAMVAADKAVEGPADTFKHCETGEPLTQVIAKISKSLKNVVRPDEVIAEFGADTFRMYEMFMGPLEASKPWNTRDVPGLFRLLNRIWRLVVDESTDGLSPALVDEPASEDVQRILHKTIKKVGQDIEAFKFNTAIGQMFDFVNFVTPLERRPRAAIETFVLLAAPFAPHLAEELWERLGHDESIAYAPWPEFNAELAQDKEIEVPVQINGKVRDRVTVPADADEAALESAARAAPKVAAALKGKTVRKVIVVKGRLVNIVCG